MKSKLLVLFVFFINFCIAQITLENTYSNAKQFNFKATQIDETTVVYYLLNDVDDTIEIYDLDHNPIKTISIPTDVRNSRVYIRILNLSKYLFDSDDEYEYTISFFNESGATNLYSCYILNEDGTILLDGTDYDINSIVGNGNPESYGIFKTLSGDLKLVLTNLNSDSSLNKVRVYSLPGITFELVVEENTLQQKINVSPNPTRNKENTIFHNFLNYGKVVIHNETGQRIKEIQLDRNKKETKINLSRQATGLYFYQIYDGNKKIGMKKVLLD